MISFFVFLKFRAFVMRLLGLRFSPMSSRLLKIDEKNFAEVIQDAARVILSGGVVAVPTESFYGLAVHALNERAVERLYAVKGRREDNPVLILIPSMGSLSSYAAEFSEKALKLVDHFWPGGLTIVFFAQGILPRSLTAGTGKIGIRLSSHPVPTELARAVGAPITGTSANRSGQPPCSTAEEVMEAVGKDIDLILDGGKTPGGKGSTVLDVTTDPPVVVREGIVTIEQLTAFL